VHSTDSGSDRHPLSRRPRGGQANFEAWKRGQITRRRRSIASAIQQSCRKCGAMLRPSNCRRFYGIRVDLTAPLGADRSRHPSAHQMLQLLARHGSLPSRSVHSRCRGSGCRNPRSISRQQASTQPSIGAVEPKTSTRSPSGSRPRTSTSRAATVEHLHHPRASPVSHGKRGPVGSVGPSMAFDPHAHQRPLVS